MEKIRIIIYSEATLPYFVGGGEVFLEKLCSFLKGKDHEVVVISNKVHKAEKFLVDYDGVKIYRIPPTVPPPSFYGWPKGVLRKSLLGIKKILREMIKTVVFLALSFTFKPNVIILNGVTITVLPSFLPGATKLKAWRIVRKIKKTKILLIVHAINPPRGKTLKNALDDSASADVIVCVEKWIKDILSSYLKNKKIIWIHNGVNISLFKFKKIKKNNNILFVGRMSDDHGLDIFLKALQIVVKDFPHVSVRIVGDGPQRDEYFRLAEDLGLIDILEFKGKVKHDLMPNEYYWAFIVVNPVRAPGIGITTLEAMSCGRIIIKSNRDINDAIIDGLNGFLFEVEDPRSLAEKIKLCLNLKEEDVESIVLNARKTILEKFDERRVFDEYEKVILEL